VHERRLAKNRARLTAFGSAHFVDLAPDLERVRRDLAVAFERLQLLDCGRCVIVRFDDSRF
jgi:hypothetical protein